MKNFKAVLITIIVVACLAFAFYVAFYVIEWIVEYFFFLFIGGLVSMVMICIFRAVKMMLHKEPKEPQPEIVKKDRGIEVRPDCESFEVKKYPWSCGDCQTDGHYLCKGCRHIAEFESMELSDNRMRYYPKQEKARIEKEEAAQNKNNEEIMRVSRDLFAEYPNLNEVYEEDSVVYYDTDTMPAICSEHAETITRQQVEDYFKNNVTDTNVGEIGATEMAVSDGRYPLFEYMSNNHGLTLLDSEMDELIDFIKKNY